MFTARNSSVLALVILLIFSACSSDLIPCPDFSADKSKRVKQKPLYAKIAKQEKIIQVHRESKLEGEVQGNPGASVLYASASNAVVLPLEKLTPVKEVITAHSAVIVSENQVIPPPAFNKLRKQFSKNSESKLTQAKARKTWNEKEVPPAAKWGFISSLLGLLTLPLVLYPLILSPIGIFLSLRALKKISKNPEQYRGKGLATAGLIMGTAVMLFFIIFLIAELSDWSGLSGWGSI